MKNNNATILIIGGIILALLILPNLGLFTIFPSNAIFPIDDVEVNSDEQSDYFGFEDDITIGWDERTKLDGSTVDYEYIGYMKFEVPQEMAELIRAGTNLSKVELHVYVERGDGLNVGLYEVGDTWNEGNVNWRNKPSIGSLIAAREMSSADEDKYIKFSPLINYFETQIREGDNQVSFAIQATKFDRDDRIRISSKERSFYAPYIIMELVEEIICTENEIKQFETDYYICKNTDWTKILDILDLSDAEQIRLMEIISQLELSIEDKTQIIENLTTTLEGQIIMITELEALTTEKAQIIIELELTLQEQATLITEMELNVAQQAIIISELDLTIQEQATLITEMELNVAQQAIIISELDLTIQEQAQLIQQMEVNLAAKAALIQLLQVENENQAALIDAMEISFAEQAGIINALENVILDDVEIITSLYDTVEDQATLISELELTKDELADLVAAMNLTVQDNVELINQLELTIDELADLVAAMDLTIQGNVELINQLGLTVEEQLAIISELELSLEQETELVDQLKLTIEEQNKLMADLEAEPTIPELDLKNLWEDYKLIIIIAGILLFLLIIIGGRKRR